jgi:hypothetical protein
MWFSAASGNDPAAVAARCTGSTPLLLTISSLVFDGRAVGLAL